MIKIQKFKNIGDELSGKVAFIQVRLLKEESIELQGEGMKTRIPSNSIDIWTRIEIF